MGGRAYIKHILLVFFIVFSISISSSLITATQPQSCCIKDNECTLVFTTPENKAECGAGYHENILCTDTSLANICTMGCCCNTGTDPTPIVERYMNKASCSTDHFTFNPTADTSCAVCGGAATTYSPCSNNTCNSVNSGICACGGVLTTAPNQYCCAASSSSTPSKVSSVQTECKTASLCIDSSTFYSISGYIYNSSSNPMSPLANILLRTSTGQDAKTDGYGYYILNGLLPGDVNITVFYNNYQVSKKNDRITSSVSNYNFYLSINTRQLCLDSTTTDSDGDGCADKYDYDCRANSFFKSLNDRNLCLSTSKNKADSDCSGNFGCQNEFCKDTSVCLTQSSPPITFCGDGKIGDGTGNTFNSYGLEEKCDLGDSSKNVAAATSSTCQSSETCVDCRCVKTSCGDAKITAQEQCDPQVINSYVPDTGASPPEHAAQCVSSACDPYTCKCINTVPTCGDGNKDTNEDCDFAAGSGNTQLVPGSLCSDAAQCIHPGFAGECRCRTVTDCGNFKVQTDKGEQCDVGAASNQAQCTGSTPKCNFATCKCAADACDNTHKQPILSNQSDSLNIYLNWGVDNACNPTSYELNKCVGLTGAPCMPSTPVSLQTPLTTSISQLKTTLTECYSVAAVYGANKFTSNIVCFNKITPDCENSPNDYFCSLDNQVMKCENGKKLPTTQSDGANGNCTSFNKTCIDSPGNTRCVSQSACELCNGPFWMFSSLDSQISNEGHCSQLLTCFVDYTPTSVDKYYECSAVDSCYDYKSEYSCNENKCNENSPQPNQKSCEWLNSTKFGELGIGVCRPKDVLSQNCNKCNSPSSENKFYGGCDASLCDLYGKDCYFRGSGVPNGCLNKNEMTCEYYMSSNDCKGGVDSNINTIWNLVNNTPLSGNNNHTVLSKDKLNFTYCRDSSTNICFKDGNWDKKPDCQTKTGTAIFDCERDFTSPTSTITYNPLGPPLKKDLSLPITVSNEDSSNNLPRYFYFNITRPGEACYPSISLSSKNISNNNTLLLTSGKMSETLIYKNMVTDFGENNTGKYTFCYFSEDDNDNYETLKNTTIKVDSQDPNVNLAVKNYSYEIAVNNDFEYVTDINFTVTLNETESATCSFWLSEVKSGVIQTPPVGSMILTDKIPDNRNRFYINYIALPDGDYELHYPCIDTAGNINSVNMSRFHIDADDSVSNVSPKLVTYGLVNQTSFADKRIHIVLDAKTIGNAICKYSQAPKSASQTLENYFTSMTQFNYTGTTVHQSDLYYHNTDSSKSVSARIGINNIYIKCNYTDKNKVFGNNGDVAIFAIDYTAPTTKLVDSNGNDFNLKTDNNGWYNSISELQGLYIKCIDAPLLFGSTDLSAGCDTINYSINLNSANPTLVDSNSKIPFTSLIPVNSNLTHIYFNGKDKLGNVENSIKDKVVKFDKDPFTYEFRIYTADGEEVRTVSSNMVYTVEINTIKNPLYNSGIPGYTISLDAGANVLGFKVIKVDGSKETIMFDPLTLTIRPDGHITAHLLIDHDVQSGTNIGQFFISSTDSHGIKSSGISAGFETFSIDNTPPTIPVFDPTFENGNLPTLKGSYPDIFNSLTTTGGSVVYYTNDKNMLITGRSRENMINFYNNSLTPFNNYARTQNAAIKETNPAPYHVFRDITKGESILTFQGDVRRYFPVGNYTSIAGKERENYTHYREYYSITSSSYDSGTSKTSVTVSPPIEKDITLSDTINVYNKPYPYDWFGARLNLLPGRSTFYAESVNKMGKTARTNDYSIYFDNNPPVIQTGTLPSDGTQTGNNMTSIVINFYDSGAGILTSDINFTVDNQPITAYTLYSTYTQTYADTGNDIYTYKLNYTPTQATQFSKGNHVVSLKLKDLARNKASTNFSFYVDPNMPSEPDFSFTGLNRSENYAEDGINAWFINSPLAFTINYFDVSINITSITLFKENYTNGVKTSPPLSIDAADCTRAASTLNSFNCVFKNPVSNLINLNDEDYTLQISAVKNLNTTPPTGIAWRRFVIDKTPPSFNITYNPRIKSDVNITFVVNIFNKEKKLKALINFDNSGKIALRPENGTSSFSLEPYKYNWQVASRTSATYSFIFYLKDLAGNENSNPYSITIDNELPNLIVTNITTFKVYISPNRQISTVEIESSLNSLTTVVNDTDVRFRGVSMNIRGNVSSDVQSLLLTKVDSNNIASGALPLISSCKNIPNLTATQSWGCFENGNFAVFNYPINGPNNQEIPYYLLFNVTDQAKNTAYYTVLLVSDLLAPTNGTITITE